MGLFSNDTDTEIDAEAVRKCIADEAGPTATPERVCRITDQLNDGEQVIHALKVSMLRYTGRDEDYESLTGRGMFGVVGFTAKRAVIRLPRKRDEDRYTVRYSQIKTASYDVDDKIGILGSWVVNNRPIRGTFFLNTGGDNYELTVYKETYKEDDVTTNKDDVYAVAEWVNEQATTSSGGGGGEESSNVRERLEELQSLHDDGLITDEEFEQKRANIIDRF